MRDPGTLLLTTRDRATSRPGPARLVCEVASDPDAIASVRAEWEDLSAGTPGANPFFAPWFLEPALKAFETSDVRIVFVREPPSQGRRLVGVVPVVEATHLRGVPLRHVKLWVHRHCFMAAPLVGPGRSGEVWRALRDWARARGAQLLDLPMVPRAHETSGGLVGLGAVRVEAFERTEFRPDPGGADAYLASAASGKSRKRWRRLRRQLELLGDLTCESLAPGRPSSDWAEAFLRLEASGWKGRDGTAMASDPGEARFFRDMTAGAHRAGALHMMRLSLNGRPVAMQCNLFGGAQGYAFKVAYDEGFAAQSPGLQLELEAIRAFSTRPGLAAVDSCTMSDNALMNRLWKDRVTIERHFLPTGRPIGALLCRLL